MSDPAGRLRRVATPDLSSTDISELRSLLWAAFPVGEEGFTEDDWLHALGGVHFVLDIDDEIVAHASVVERDLHIGETPVRTGYVEAVAVNPAHQGQGLGTRVMREVNEHIRSAYELGALGTGSHRFYERLGWQTWRGPTFVRTDDGTTRSEDEDGYILVLETPTSPPLDFDAPISCDWRAGDSW
jgi:aminoglycoside 2'-N-acetyltransferase I